MRIILHIGHFKTGSTAFQTILSKNRSVLALEGVCYPLDEGRFPHQQGSMLERATHHSDFSPIRKAIESARRHGCHTVIFSGEVAANASAERAADLVKYLNQFGRVQVIYVIRHWRSYLPSRYVQNIKRGDSWTWPDFFKACKADFETFSDLNFRLVADAYSMAEEISLEAYQADVCDRLLALLGLQRLSPQIQRINASNFSNDWEVKRLVNGIVNQHFGIAENRHYSKLKEKKLGGDIEGVANFRTELMGDKKLLEGLLYDVEESPIHDFFEGYDFSSWEQTLCDFEISLDPAEPKDFRPSFASISVK